MTFSDIGAAASVSVTFFPNAAAQTKREEVLPLRDLANRIATTTASSKTTLPWMKLARFGDLRTADANSLRHNANVVTISGVEADYDGEKISFTGAVDTLRKAGVKAIIYTSPSHTEDTPRWRVLCALSKELPPDQRSRHLARLNGLFGGIFSGESWTLSQSYYYGSVNRSPSHLVELIDGTPIDLMDELDAGAIGKPATRRGNGAERPISSGGAYTPASDARLEAWLLSVLDTLRREAADGQKHFALLRCATALGGIQAAARFSDAEAWQRLKDCLPDSVLDWDAAEKTAIDGLARGRAKPIVLEDRPHSFGNGSAPPSGNRGQDADQHGTSGADAPEEPRSDTEPESDAWNTNTAPDGETEPVGGDLDALRDLRILKSDLPMVSQKLRDRLAIHPRLFERGGPARLVSFPSEQDRQAEVHQLGGDAVVHAAHEVCRPYQIDARGKRNNVTLPERVAKLYLALNGRWHLRTLHGICGSVLLDNDGGIHSHEGYHAPSGMWCTRTPPLNVPDQPFKDQAVDALYRLRAAMRTFTFKGSRLTRIDGIDADVVDIEGPPGLCESAALSGLLTAVCRASLPLAPGVMINAPSVSGSGAGKGLLARMIVAIAFGIIAKAGTAGHDEQELEKRIGAILLRGEPVLLLDNLNNTLLRSAQLESCLTEPLVSVRLFGVLKMQDVRCTALVVVTGNGVQASGDTARRFIYPTLEPPVDNPEQRQYPAGFLDGILARRGELLSDCLTVWRWGRQQSNLKRGLPFGSYERWAAWVRDPLLALGCDDPVKGVQDARDRDPHRVNIAALFAEWRFRHGGDWQKADELHPAVRRMVDEKERVPAIRQKLSQMANTRLGGFRLECTVEGNAANRVSLYRVIEIESNCPD
jgi:hypothetical protein